MDILDYALKMEKDGENFYREIAEKTSNKGLRNILIMLANEEIKHYNAIERIKQGNCQMTETTVLDDAKNIFVEIKEQGEEFEPDKDQAELYAKAQEIEKESQQFYADKAGQADNEDQRKLFERLAKEEEKHYFLLENIIAFVSRPDKWLENAEWHHLEDY